MSEFAEVAISWAERYFTPHSSQLLSCLFERARMSTWSRTKRGCSAATWETKRIDEEMDTLTKRRMGQYLLLSTLLWRYYMYIGGIGPGFSTIMLASLLEKSKSANFMIVGMLQARRALKTSVRYKYGLAVN